MCSGTRSRGVGRGGGGGGVGGSTGGRWGNVLQSRSANLIAGWLCRLAQAREAAQQLARGSVQQVQPVLARLADQQGVTQQLDDSDDSLHSATADVVFADEEEVPQVSLIGRRVAFCSMSSECAADAYFACRAC